MGSIRAVLERGGASQFLHFQILNADKPAVCASAQKQAIGISHTPLKGKTSVCVCERSNLKWLTQADCLGQKGGAEGVSAPLSP